MNDTTHSKSVSWIKWGILFGALQLFLFGLGFLVKFTRGQTSPVLGEAIVGSEENDDYYNQFRQPIFAPPDWAFAPVWTINNALTTWGIVRVQNMPDDMPGRERYLQLLGAFLVLFVNFNAGYFGLNSPINGALLTVPSLVTVAEAMRIAVFELKDLRVVLSLCTLLPWLILASFTSVIVALWNRDGFYHTRVLIEPPQSWVKQQAKKSSKKVSRLMQSIQRRLLDIVNLHFR